MLRICHDARLIINGTLQPTKLLHFHLLDFKTLELCTSETHKQEIICIL